jgi:hypothetical protein
MRNTAPRCVGPGESCISAWTPAPDRVLPLTTKDVDDGWQVGPLLDQISNPVASFTGDGAYDQESVAASVTVSVAERCPAAAVIVPPRSDAAPSDTAAKEATQRDCHLQHVEPEGSPDIAEHGCMAWQTAAGYTKRAKAETGMSRFKQVIGDGLRLHTDARQATEGRVAVHGLNRMLKLGRPNSVRIA